MRIKQMVFLILMALLSSCQMNKNKNEDMKKEEVSMNQPKRDITEIQDEVLAGNIQSYEKLKIIYLDYPSNSFLFWAMLMANKYDYPQAYLDVFYTLINSFVGGIYGYRELDQRTKELALEYLTIASEKKVEEAEKMLIEIKETGGLSSSN